MHLEMRLTASGVNERLSIKGYRTCPTETPPLRYHKFTWQSQATEMLKKKKITLKNNSISCFWGIHQWHSPEGKGCKNDLVMIAPPDSYNHDQ